MLCKELDSLRYSHIQHVIDVLTMELHIKNLTFETLSVTGFTLQNKVCHELHLNRYDARPLAFFASTTVYVERKELWAEAHLFG